MKIITFYLPQFHTFPENDEWWGKGFTEWTNVRNALPSFQGHKQPRIPYQNNYYNLLNPETIRWQTKLAKEYGIYGFCFYHYWFDDKMLMNKPMEILLEHQDIDISFCISWANENWTRTWASKERTILIGQTYGDKEMWKKHFEYLLPFFRDERYINIDGHPIFIIYRPELIDCLKEMLEFWDGMAAECGLPKIYYIYQQIFYNHLKDKNGYLFEFGIEYQPGFVRQKQQKTISLITRKLLNETVHKFGLNQKRCSTIYYDYDDTWKRILQVVPRDEKMFPGAFVDWDNTPRYKGRSSVVIGYTKEKFQYYLTKQICRTKEVYHKDMLFLFAWNEWGEGGYLEPDEEEKFSRLEAVKNALEECGELEIQNIKI